VGIAIASEDVSGDWRCLHQNGDYTASRGQRIVGSKLIETTSFGARQIIPNVVISPDFVFWNGSALQEFEFNPQTMKLIETSRLSIKSQATILEYKCEKK
jgi:hypothetical protein